MISVIVPIYDVEKYLRRCIDSIIAQTYTNLEIILVDDGSTDACPKICDEYAVADPRIKVIHKRNGGLSDARNAGLEMATGEFVGFVDSDDYILPQMYEVLYGACIEYDVPIAMCGRRVVNEENKVIRYEYRMDDAVIFSAKEAIELLLKTEKCDSAVWDKLYKRQLFSDIWYPEGVHYEDQNITGRLFYRAGRICHVGQVLYVYRKREDSITVQPFNQHSIDEVKQAELLKKYLDMKYPDLEEKTLYFVSYKMGFVLSKACKCKNNEMKAYMEEVGHYGQCYFKHAMRGRLNLIRKVWFCKNYFILRLRLWWWRQNV